MRKLELLSVGDELYGVVKVIPYSKFKIPIEGEAATFLKQVYKCEKILKGNQTNEYIFVNLIPEAKIEIEMTNKQRKTANRKRMAKQTINFQKKKRIYKKRN